MQHELPTEIAAPKKEKTFKEYLQGNEGPFAASILTDSPVSAGAAGAAAQALFTPRGQSRLLQSLGVGGGAALANFVVSPVTKSIAKTISATLGQPSGSFGEALIGVLLQDLPTGAAQAYAATVGRNAAKRVEKSLNNRNGKKMPNQDTESKTAERSKLSFMVSPAGVRSLRTVGAGLKGALPGAAAGAALGYLSAPEDQGAAGAARGAMYGGLATGGLAALRHGMARRAGPPHFAQTTSPRLEARNVIDVPFKRASYRSGATAALASFAL